jgi:hypothetical protein
MSTNASVKSGFAGGTRSMSDEFVPTAVSIESIHFDGKFRAATPESVCIIEGRRILNLPAVWAAIAVAIQQKLEQ